MAEDKNNGRPTKYKKEYDKQAEKLCLLGATDAQLADFFEVAESTLYLWKKEHKSFSEALKAKSFSDDAVERSLYQRAIGHEVVETTEKQSENGYEKTTKTKMVADTTAMIFWLKNRRPEKWRDKVEQEEKQQDIIINIDTDALGIKKDA